MSERREPARLVLASRNTKKIAELRELLAGTGIEVQSSAEFPDVPEIVEDGATFAENAAKKASETARHLGCWALGEDSGLEVAALNGGPGIFSARYSGPGATDQTNNARLIEQLAGVPDEQRNARYVCNVALADPSGTVREQVEASCRGRITRESRGTNGFGYDPYFLIREYHRTFGELSPSVKRRLSHRARALEKIVPCIVRLVGSPGPIPAAAGLPRRSAP